MTCWPALLRQDVRHIEIVWRIADRHGDDPLARPLAARKLGDPVLDVANRAHTPERGKHVAQRLAIGMGVAVGDARHDGFALQVDDPRRRSGVRCHRGIRPDRQDAVAGDCDRLRDRENGIDRNDLAVLENEIGRDGGWCGGSLRHG